MIRFFTLSSSKNRSPRSTTQYISMSDKMTNTIVIIDTETAFDSEGHGSHFVEPKRWLLDLIQTLKDKDERLPNVVLCPGKHTAHKTPSRFSPQTPAPRPPSQLDGLMQR